MDTNLSRKKMVFCIHFFSIYLLISRHLRYYLLYSFVVHYFISQSVIDLVYLKQMCLCILVQKQFRLLRNILKLYTCVLFGFTSAQVERLLSEYFRRDLNFCCQILIFCFFLISSIIFWYCEQIRWKCYRFTVLYFCCFTVQNGLFEISIYKINCS